MATNAMRPRPLRSAREASLRLRDPMIVGMRARPDLVAERNRLLREAAAPSAGATRRVPAVVLAAEIDELRERVDELEAGSGSGQAIGPEG